MRNIAAYLLLQAGGKENPTAADIKTLLAVVGIETDEDRLKLLVSELSGKSVNEVIAQGLGKLASVPGGGGGGGGSGGAGPAAAGGAAPAAEKEEEKPEEKEESDEDMGFGLFD